MWTRGRPPNSSEAERQRVRELAATGLSIRRIAALVLGDARYRGRVERILRRRDTPQGRGEQRSPAELEAELAARARGA